MIGRTTRKYLTENGEIDYERLKELAELYRKRARETKRKQREMRRK